VVFCECLPGASPQAGIGRAFGANTSDPTRFRFALLLIRKMTTLRSCRAKARLSLDAGAAAFHDALDFVEGSHGGVAGGGHGEGSVGAAAVDGPVGAFVG